MEATISTPAKDFQVAGISRSGRVRKKSSKLLDFESPEEIEKRTKRPGRPAARYPGRGRPPNALREREQELALAYELDDDDDDDVDNHISDMEHSAPAIGGTVDLHGALMNSDDELDTLVQDLVEGVEAEASCYTNDSRVRQSLYMREKTNKRKVLNNAQGKTQRKDKGRSRFTAYSLWARDVRKRDFPDLDFANAARRLSELWANVSNKDKNAWRRKAKSQATKARTREKNAPADMSPIGVTQSMTSNGNSFAAAAAAADATETTFMNRPTTSRTKKLAAERRQTTVATTTLSNSVTTTTTPPTTWAQSRQKRTSYSRAKANQVTTASTSNQLTNARGSSSSGISALQQDVELGKGTGIEAIDAAAHLKLLGESLTVIGERLKEHNGHVALSGSLSVLLDSLLCSMGPLLCMTTQIPGLENKKQLSTNLATTLDNIAYVMPGL